MCAAQKDYVTGSYSWCPPWNAHSFNKFYVTHSFVKHPSLQVVYPGIFTMAWSPVLHEVKFRNIEASFKFYHWLQSNAGVDLKPLFQNDHFVLSFKVDEFNCLVQTTKLSKWKKTSWSCKAWEPIHLQIYICNLLKMSSSLRIFKFN